MRSFKPRSLLHLVRHLLSLWVEVADAVARPRPMVEVVSEVVGDSVRVAEVARPFNAARLVLPTMLLWEQVAVQRDTLELLV